MISRSIFSINFNINIKRWNYSDTSNKKISSNQQRIAFNSLEGNIQDIHVVPEENIHDKMVILMSCCCWDDVWKGSFASGIYTLVSARASCVVIFPQGVYTWYLPYQFKFMLYHRVELQKPFWDLFVYKLSKTFMIIWNIK